MSDIANAIYRHLRTMAPHQLERLTASQLREAADEIARLRAELSVARQHGETGQPVLNGAERMAINSAIYLCESAAGLADENANATAWATCAATLRGLLERHGACPEREQPARKGVATPARSGETGGDSPDRE
jgi:hypothetical protein